MDEEFTGVESLTDLDMFVDLYVDSAELAGSAYFFSYDVNGTALRHQDASSPIVAAPQRRHCRNASPKGAPFASAATASACGP